MLTDLRVKLRTRRSRIVSCGFEDFLPLTKQFYKFLDSSPILRAVIAELLARNRKTAAEVQNAAGGGSGFHARLAENAFLR